MVSIGPTSRCRSRSIPLSNHFLCTRASTLEPCRAAQSRRPEPVCLYANGVTRVLRGMPFRAAACTGALYHIEIYIVCRDLPDLEAGVYQYAAHDHSLRQIRRGDFRRTLVEASGEEPSVAAAPAIVVCTSTFWRNAWKYRARAYRHCLLGLRHHAGQPVRRRRRQQHSSPTRPRLRRPRRQCACSTSTQRRRRRCA